MKPGLYVCGDGKWRMAMANGDGGAWKTTFVSPISARIQSIWWPSFRAGIRKWQNWYNALLDKWIHKMEFQIGSLLLHFFYRNCDRLWENEFRVRKHDQNSLANSSLYIWTRTRESWNAFLQQQIITLLWSKVNLMVDSLYTCFAGAFGAHLTLEL